MKAVCPDCGRSFDLDLYPEEGHDTWCSNCGKFFSTVGHLRFEPEGNLSGKDTESFVVEWQIGGTRLD